MRAEVEAAIQVEKQTRGSGSRDNTGGRSKGSYKVEKLTERGDPIQYKRVEVAGVLQVEKAIEGRPETIQEAGSRGGYTSREADRLRRPETIRRAEGEAAIQVEKQETRNNT